MDPRNNSRNIRFFSTATIIGTKVRCIRGETGGWYRERVKRDPRFEATVTDSGKGVSSIEHVSVL